MAKKTKQQVFLDAYVATFGNITASTKHAGVVRQTFYHWMNDQTTDGAEFRLAVENAAPKERFLDFTESALYGQIKAGNITAIIFALKTKGRERGYIERHEVEHFGFNWGDVATEAKAKNSGDQSQ